MKLNLLTLVALLAMAAPTWANRGHPGRGERFVDSSRSSWGVAIGYSGGYSDGESFAIEFGYSDGPRYDYGPGHYRRPPVYVAPVPIPIPPPPPPVVYYPQPVCYPYPVYYPRPVYYPQPVYYPRPYPTPWDRGGYVHFRGHSGDRR